jgi:hypothetical protein
MAAIPSDVINTVTDLELANLIADAKQGDSGAQYNLGCDA